MADNNRVVFTLTAKVSAVELNERFQSKADAIQLEAGENGWARRNNFLSTIEGKHVLIVCSGACLSRDEQVELLSVLGKKTERFAILDIERPRSTWDVELFKSKGCNLFSASFTHQLAVRNTLRLIFEYFQKRFLATNSPWQMIHQDLLGSVRSVGEGQSATLRPATWGKLESELPGHCLERGRFVVVGSKSGSPLVPLLADRIRSLDGQVTIISSDKLLTFGDELNRIDVIVLAHYSEIEPSAFSVFGEKTLVVNTGPQTLVGVEHANKLVDSGALIVNVENGEDSSLSVIPNCLDLAGHMYAGRASYFKEIHNHAVLVAGLLYNYPFQSIKGGLLAPSEGFYTNFPKLLAVDLLAGPTSLGTNSSQYFE